MQGRGRVTAEGMGRGVVEVGGRRGPREIAADGLEVGRLHRFRGLSRIRGYSVDNTAPARGRRGRVWSQPLLPAGFMDESLTPLIINLLRTWYHIVLLYGTALAEGGAALSGTRL